MRDYDKLSREDLIRLLSDRDGEDVGGIRLTYPGQAAPWQIVRRVKPRSQRIETKLCVGTEQAQAENLIIEGENLQALVSLYKYRGQVDLVLTDPPYNTGQDFRYNDRWEEDPNDPDLGELVPADDGSRHSKWLRFMVPRLWMIREMLKPSGVLAICIDQRELFRLGMVLDQMFGEANRLAIINWQKTTSKNDRKHVASTTEYILVYAKDEGKASTRLLGRSEKANARFGNPDRDLDGDWKQGDSAAMGDFDHPTMIYAIQSPFTGEMHYPPVGRHWTNEKSRMKAWLQEWGSTYQELDLKDDRPKALVIKGAPRPGDKDFRPDHPVLAEARKAAEARLAAGSWPRLYFGHTGKTKPMMKIYLSEVKAGSVPTTFWVDAEEAAAAPVVLDSVSWDAQETGRSREGIEELDEIIGKGHGFQTVKPLKLMRKVVQIWCPPNGIVMDPFAGSGTTGHAVLQLNTEAETKTRFVLIEQGRPERGDSYARTLTAERIARAISGKRAGKARKKDHVVAPLPGAFRFSQLMSTVDAAAVLALEREEMVDLLLTSHWDQKDRNASHLYRLPAGSYEYLFAKSARGEGFFLVWNGPDKPSVLNRAAFRAIAQEAAAERLSHPFHVYARISTYSGPNVEFYQIPNRILEKLGFNEAVHLYGTAAQEEAPAEEDAA